MGWSAQKGKQHPGTAEAAAAISGGDVTALQRSRSFSLAEELQMIIGLIRS